MGVDKEGKDGGDNIGQDKLWGDNCEVTMSMWEGGWGGFGGEKRGVEQVELGRLRGKVEVAVERMEEGEWTEENMKLTWRNVGWKDDLTCFNVAGMVRIEVQRW